MKQSYLNCFRILLCLFFTFLFGSIYAQLPAFSISVTSKPQTCLGNGELEFTITGASPNAAVEFAVYLLPDTVQPVTTVTALNASGLVAGNYKVVATQSLNGEFNTASANSILADNRSPFDYKINVVNTNCNTQGSITVEVLSGTAVQYEIISGPKTFVPQTSNVFLGLPPGSYQVRVYDSCGNAVVKTIQVSLYTGSLIINWPNIAEGYLPSCSTISVEYSLSVQSPGAIVYPLSITYEVFPPGSGTPVLLEDTLAFGDTNVLFITKDIPFYNGATYSYNVKITDGCGQVVTQVNNEVKRPFDFDISPASPDCNKFFLQFYPNNYSFPITVNFINAPVGFDPNLYSTTHPLSSQDPVVYGSNDNTLPLGNYVIQLTDSCGRTLTKSVVLGEGGVPKIELFENGCLHDLKITLPRTVVSAKITVAPTNYGAVLPKDAMEFTNSNVLYMTSLVSGNYQFEFTDICGTSYDVGIGIPESGPVQHNVTQYNGCLPGLGSLRVTLARSSLESFIITAAPSGFNHPLPYNASANIAYGVLYMGALPGGSYTFNTVDACGNKGTGTVIIQALVIDNDPADVVYNCGSFDVSLHNATGLYTEGRYYLQKYDEASGQWINPDGGNSSPGVELQNNSIRYSLSYEGQFRIIIEDYYYRDAADNTSGVGKCQREIYNFVFTGKPSVLGAYAFPCLNGLAEVIIDAVGAPPLTYAITLKDNQEFVVDNYENMVFMALEKGIYNFEVTDACGNITNIRYDISKLEPLEIMQRGFCEGDASSLYVKPYTFLQYQWWKEGAPNVILSTASSLDFASYNEADSGGKYFLKIVSITPGSCIDVVLEHSIESPKSANAGVDKAVTICDSVLSINLDDYLEEGHDTGGIWAVTSTTNVSLVNGKLTLLGLSPGVYTFKYTIARCNAIDEALLTVEYLGNNSFDVELASGCISSDFSLTVTGLDSMPGASVTWSGPGGYSYSGPVAVITDRMGGKYKAIVTTLQGCTSEASINVEATTCSFPRGVSSNNDGYNDSFDLTDMNVARITIYNRYGLEVYSADNYVKEWYGQTNDGKQLITGVYYYSADIKTGGRKTGWVYLQLEQ